jgi:hypothetical protein
MSKPSEILTQIKTQLQNSADLSYVNDYNILLGVRDNMVQYPCIIIEPLGLLELDYVYPKQKLHFKIAVVGFIKVTNIDKQIVGDSTDKGILDLENHVKKALSSDITLGGYAHKLEIKETAYEFVEYPVRSFSISVDVMFEQIATTR